MSSKFRRSNSGLRSSEPGRYVGEYQMSMPHHWESLSKLSIKDSIVRTSFANYMKNPKDSIIGTESSSLNAYENELRKKHPNEKDYVIDLLVYEKDQSLQKEKRAQNARMRKEVQHRRRNEIEKKVSSVDIRKFVDANGNPVNFSKKNARAWLKENYPQDYKQLETVTMRAEQHHRALRLDRCHKHIEEHQRVVTDKYEERREKADEFREKQTKEMAGTRGAIRKANEAHRDENLEKHRTRFEAKIEHFVEVNETVEKKAARMKALKEEEQRQKLQEINERRERRMQEAEEHRREALNKSQMRREENALGTDAQAKLKFKNKLATQQQQVEAKALKRLQAAEKQANALKKAKEEEKERLNTLIQRENEKQTKSEAVLEGRQKQWEEVKKDHHARHHRVETKLETVKSLTSEKEQKQIEKRKEMERIHARNLEAMLEEKAKAAARFREKNEALLLAKKMDSNIEAPYVAFNGESEDEESTPEKRSKNKQHDRSMLMGSKSVTFNVESQASQSNLKPSESSSNMARKSSTTQLSPTAPASPNHNNSSNNIRRRSSVHSLNEEELENEYHNGDREEGSSPNNKSDSGSMSPGKYRNAIAQRWNQMDMEEEERRLKILSTQQKKQETAERIRDEQLDQRKRELAQKKKDLEEHQKRANERQAARLAKIEESVTAHLQKIETMPPPNRERSPRLKSHWKGWEEVDRLAEHHCTAYHRLHVVAPPREFNASSQFPNPVRQVIADKHARDIRAERGEEWQQERAELMEKLNEKMSSFSERHDEQQRLRMENAKKMNRINQHAIEERERRRQQKEESLLERIHTRQEKLEKQLEAHQTMQQQTIAQKREEHERKLRTVQEKRSVLHLDREAWVMETSKENKQKNLFMPIEEYNSMASSY